MVLHDLHPPASDLCEDVRVGLGGREKKLSPKWFYDERGARLFERICALQEYYPTRTEISILERFGSEIADAIGPEAVVVEFGSGSGIKTHIVLEHLERPLAYVPIDISRAQLVEFAEATAEAFPGLEVLPVCADYTQPLELPDAIPVARRTVSFFPGSTIGNFEPPEAEAFLRRVARLAGADGRLLIGVDLEKERALVEAAYNDSAGVTADFNLNLLRRINRECGGDFDLEGFEHRAFLDARHGRIVLQLVSRHDQVVRLEGSDGAPPVEISFGTGESITTEYSYKYDPDDFAALAARAGWATDRFWTDANRWFGVFLLRPERTPPG